MAASDKARVVAATLVCQQHLASSRDAIDRLGNAADRGDYERARVFLKGIRTDLAAAQREIDGARRIVDAQDGQSPDIESCVEELDLLEREVNRLATSIGQIRD